MNLKIALSKKLTKKELEQLRRGYDIIGDIAIIEIPYELRKRQKLIARAIMQLHPNIKVVAKKVGIHTGRYRTQKLTILAGEKRKETEHKESGTRMLLDVEKCYFSPRLGSERLRIAQQIKKKETVLVMFSGVAPYPLVLTKQSPAKHITGIEINPIAHEYGIQNVLLNKLHERITLIKGDVRKIVPTLKQKYDRIIIPLPKTGEKYLDLAFSVAKKGATIHLYDFKKDEEIQYAGKDVMNICTKYKKRCTVLRIVKAGAYAPRVYRICIDFKVN